MSENTTPNLQPESSLPIAPTIGEIDHFRIINKNGQSQKATITQVRELMGMDYSKLEEQVVHGEFWIVNGVKKQVYVKTLTGTTPSPWSAVEFPLAGSPAGITALSLVVGHVGSYLLPNWGLAGGVQEWVLRYAANLIQLGVPNYPTTSLNGCPYSLTFKYTY